jgi:hypothetical protein
MAKRIYSIGMQTFEIMVTGTPTPTSLSWTIESVKESGDGSRDLAIPGMCNVVAAAEDMAFSRACDRIDEWLMSTR